MFLCLEIWQSRSSGILLVIVPFSPFSQRFSNDRRKHLAASFMRTGGASFQTPEALGLVRDLVWPQGDWERVRLWCG